jgi:hypothetical protein
MVSGRFGKPLYTILWGGSTDAKDGGFLLVTLVMKSESRISTIIEPEALPVIPSMFGDLQPYIQEWEQVAYAAPTLEPSNKTISWYGVRCNLLRSHGSMNLTRAQGRVTDWTISSSAFEGPTTEGPNPLQALYHAIFPTSHLLDRSAVLVPLSVHTRSLESQA